MSIIKEKIREIIKSLKEDGYKEYCWFKKNGKLISCGAKNQLNIFLKKNNYDGKQIIEVKLEINGTSKNLKQKDDIILVTATVKTVKIRKIGISLTRRNDENSILEVKYNHKELDSFDASDLKYIAMIAYSGKYEIVYHKDEYLTFTKIKKDIKKIKS